MELYRGRYRIKAIYHGSLYLPGAFVNECFYPGSPGFIYGQTLKGTYRGHKVYHNKYITSDITVLEGGILFNCVTDMYSGVTISVKLRGTISGLQVRLGTSAVLYTDAKAIDTTVMGLMLMQQGAYASNTVISSNGFLYMNDIEADTITVSSGGSCIMKNSRANIVNVTVLKGGYLLVCSGGTATNVEAKTGAVIGLNLAFSNYISNFSYNDSAVNVECDTIYDYTIASSGYINLKSGGKAQRAIVQLGNLYVSSGGIARETIINSGGTACVTAGGFMNFPVVNQGGVLLVSSGGTAFNVTSSAGALILDSGGIITYLEQTEEDE